MPGDVRQLWPRLGTECRHGGKDAKGPVKATLTLLERTSNGSFTAVDSTDIMLPLARGITDGLKLQIVAGKLFG